MKLIELAQINKVYNPGKENELLALKNVNLEIFEGDFVAIMGPSGSGKSTLMNLIGLLDTPTTGNYVFMHKDISKALQTDLAKLRSDEIGFIFQNFNLLGRTSVLNNVSLPLLYNKGKSNDDPGRLLDLVGLGDKKNSKPNQLSGGQMQRVAIARALVNRPSLVLADEPTGNLDTKTGQDIMRLLVSLNNQGKTIVVVTHDMHIASYAKKIIHMADGEIVKQEDRF